MLWHLAYALFCLADHAVWLLVKLMPGSRLLALIRARPWRRCSPRLPPPWRTFLLLRFSRLLKQRCRGAGAGSSCLSRALLSRVLLDLIGVPNQLHIGMNRPDGPRRVPHAWLSCGPRDLSPGLSPGHGCRILTL
jgi:hypothetical protein